MKITKRKALSLFGIAFALSLFAQQASPKERIEDIDYFKKQLTKTIPDFQTRVDQLLFSEKITQLKKKVGAADISKDEFVLGLQEILGMIEDEGCSIYPFQSSLDYPLLPLKTYWFENGLFICDASEQYAHLKGQKILEINDVSIADLFKKLGPVIPGDNELSKRYNFSLYSQIPAWLTYAGASVDDNKAELTLESGHKESVSFAPVADYIELKLDLASYRQLESDKSHQENYWMEFLPEEKLLFVQFLQIRNNDSGPSISDFIDELAEKINSLTIDKVVIDNRYGGGGNGFKLKPLTDLLKKNERVNQKGKLFVLTSRNTRGTVMEMTSLLEINTKAIIIGENTGEGPNSVGDNKSIELPNSKISVYLTHTFWPTNWPSDKRISLEPHVPISYSFNDFVTREDPWLKKVLSHTFHPSSTPVPAMIMKGLEGNHKIEGRKITISTSDGRMFMSMDRKMMTFFEFRTELYFEKQGVLNTDIADVWLKYDKNYGLMKLEYLHWKGADLPVDQ